MIADNLKSVRQRIARSCEKVGRSSEDVTLVCVTKEASVPQIEEALSARVTNLGENRVQELASKYKLIGDRAAWHLVGHLQTNKVKDVVRIAALIHSVDSIRLAEAINKEASKIGKIQDILVQVNTSGEKTKFGLVPAKVADFIKESAIYTNISVKGLMTIAPEVGDPETARPYFRKLKELSNKIYELRVTSYELRTLSIGMSDDFEVAIEEGSTMVRIGRAIFGSVKCKT
jgi:PLP dependent protein